MAYHAVNYYEPIPDSRALSNDLWSTRSLLSGVDINEPFQIDLLKKFHSAFSGEYDRFPKSSSDPHQFHFGQTMFQAVDAEILYCMIRHFKPRRMIEVGSGISTPGCRRDTEKSSEDILLLDRHRALSSSFLVRVQGHRTA
jgi:hypothetical protein